MVSAQLPSNKTKSRPLTVAHSHVSLQRTFESCVLFIVCLNKFIISGPISDANEGTSKDSNASFTKRLEIHCGGDLPLKLSMNADLKFSANDEGVRCQRQESTGREHRLPVIA